MLPKRRVFVLSCLFESVRLPNIGEPIAQALHVDRSNNFKMAKIFESVLEELIPGQSSFLNNMS